MNAIVDLGHLIIHGENDGGAEILADLLDDKFDLRVSHAARAKAWVATVPVVILFHVALVTVQLRDRGDVRDVALELPIATALVEPLLFVPYVVSIQLGEAPRIRERGALLPSAPPGRDLYGRQWGREDDLRRGGSCWRSSRGRVGGRP